MPLLSETQKTFRDAIVSGSAASLLPRLRSPADPLERLDIYRRHHREGFRRHLCGRYPTLEWLLGTEELIALADLTLRRTPPHQPSLAEYGAELIETVMSRGDSLPPYAADVARLDWQLGCVSVAVAGQPLTLAALAAIDPRQLAQVCLTLQPGVVYLRAGWPVDEFIHLRFRDSLPAELTFDPCETLLQLRGARGQFSLQRIGRGSFAFRSHLAVGHSLAAAAAAGAGAQQDFDLSFALGSLFDEGLVIHHSPENHNA